MTPTPKFSTEEHVKISCAFTCIIFSRNSLKKVNFSLSFATCNVFENFTWNPSKTITPLYRKISKFSIGTKKLIHCMRTFRRNNESNSNCGRTFFYICSVFSEMFLSNAQFFGTNGKFDVLAGCTATFCLRGVVWNFWKKK